MAMFDARNVRANQSGATLDVALREFLLFSKGSDSLTNAHLSQYIVPSSRQEGQCGSKIF